MVENREMRFNLKNKSWYNWELYEIGILFKMWFEERKRE